MNLVPWQMNNNDSDTEYKRDVDSYSDVNVSEEVNSEEVNVSDVVPF